MVNNRVWMMVCFPIFGMGALSCGAAKDAGAPSMPQDVDATAFVDAEPVEDVIAPGPLCVSDGDCIGVFFDLGTCEVVRCDPMDGQQGVCVRDPLPTGQPCQDHNPCTFWSTCDGDGGCQGGEGPACEDRSCMISLGCSEATGECAYEPVEDGGSCSDGNPCTLSDTCVSASCVGAYDTNSSACACTRDKDCPAPDTPCFGDMRCSSGVCTLPTDSVHCDQSLAGPCERVQCDSDTGGCVTVLQADETPCDDENPCTVADRCVAGSCLSGENHCSCASDSDCQSFQDQDLCNGQLGCVLSENNGGVCEVILDSVPVCDPSGFSCVTSQCQPATGLCTPVPVEDGVSCDDSDACTHNDRCISGECTGGSQALCGPPTQCDAGACTPQCWDVPACDPALGCEEHPLEGPCIDGMACHIQDMCVNGVCTQGSLEVQCNDGNPCTNDGCDDVAGCVFTATDGACSDGDPCTINDSCFNGDCVSDTPMECEDGNQCTTDFCIAGTGCAHIFNNAPCEDGDPCTEGDACQAGDCKPGDKVCPCNEDANCTVPNGGNCAGVWHCIANQCVLESTAATGCPSTGSPCVLSVCDEVTGTCQSTPAPTGIPCDDANECTVGDACKDSQCVSSAFNDCDDDSVCTADSCDPLSGCVYAPSPGLCDDGDPCSVQDLCVDGECLPGAGACECMVDTDCTQPKNKCLGLRRCVNHQCKLDPTTVVSCSSSGVGPCLSADCIPLTGECDVSLQPDGVDCDDDNACTISETCSGGACVSKDMLQCPDDNPCTVSSCDPQSGCTSIPTDGPCNDGDSCTTDEHCVDGVCTGTISQCDELCDNGHDDDGDDAVDCEDSDCVEESICDPCATAPFLSCGGIVTGILGDQAPSLVGNSACGAGDLGDTVFQFTTNNGGEVTLSLSSTGGAFALRVLTAAADGGCQLSSCKGSGQDVVFTAAPAVVYHVVVEKLFLGGASTFEVSASCAVDCVPACETVNCGPDGCGESCGACNDGNPCTNEWCVDGACVAVGVDGCCQFNSDCDDNDLCTKDYCEGMVCHHSDVLECCQTALDCDDGVDCTTDACSGGFCVYQPGPNCCVSDIDCATGKACEVGTCQAGHCVTVNVPGCCEIADDCVDVGPCDVPYCVGQQCVITKIPACCTSAMDCEDANPCTVNTCDIVKQSCQQQWVPNCCLSSLECAADDDACTTAQCVEGECNQVPIANCCLDDADCGNAPFTACMASQCQNNVCVAEPMDDCCTSDSACDDSDSCTSDQCVANTCVHNAVVGCCTTNSVCDDLDPCTNTACLNQQCEVSILASCCLNDADCADTNPCTDDRCNDGICENPIIVECCTKSADCVAGPCLNPVCNAGQCAYIPLPGCCGEDSDCTQLSPCLQSACLGGTCTVSAQADCCVTASECPLPAGPCERTVCTSNQCGSEVIAGCCVVDMDCASLVGPCEQAHCSGHVCVVEDLPGCCQNLGDCADDQVPCVNTSCVEGSCETSIQPDCCSSDEQCSDGSAPCGQGVCSNGACEVFSEPGCCVVQEDCNSMEAEPCDEIQCVLGQCMVTGQINGCCLSPNDCPELDDLCVLRDCVDNQCVLAPILGCCEAADDCPEATEACQQRTCQDGSCALESIEGCCTSGVVPCEDDENPCTEQMCVGQSCVSQPLPGCCVADMDCATGNELACTTMQCVDSQCVALSTSGCCVDDTDCLGGGDCSQVMCLGNTCADIPITGCCTQDSECPESEDGCVVAACLNGQCGWDPLDDCCAYDVDCPQSSDPCVAPTCSDGQCTGEASAGCALGACLYQGFDLGDFDTWETSATQTALDWAVTPDEKFGGSHAAKLTYGGGYAGVVVSMTSPAFQVTGESWIRFRYRLSKTIGDCSDGQLRVLAIPADGSNPTVLWARCNSEQQWAQIVVALDDLVGQLIRVRFELDTAEGTDKGFAALDDIAVSGSCSLACETDCINAPACASTQCVNGLCESTPLPACCVSDEACADDDPCTLNECNPAVGCAVSPVSGCLSGACVGSVLTDGLDDGWTIDGNVNLTFKTTTLGSLGSPGHLIAVAGSTGAGEATTVHLPALMVTSDTLSLRLLVRQSVGSACEQGRLMAVTDTGLEIPLPCGYHDWRPIQVPIPSSINQVVRIGLRFDAFKEGASVEVDDLRVFGSCQPIECTEADQCDDGNSCTLSACDSGYQCQYLWTPGCCEIDADCVSLEGLCDVGTCAGGTCVISQAPGCDVGACLFEAFDDGFPENWTLGNEQSVVSGIDMSWSVDAIDAYSEPFSLHAHAFLPESFQSGATVRSIRLPQVLVGSGTTALTFMVKRDFPEADCTAGAVEVWAKENLLWLGCGDTDTWIPVTIPLGSWAGDVIQPMLRFRVGGTPGTTTNVFVDDLRIDGDCVPTTCLTASDCADGNVCTKDVCMGYQCVYLTQSDLCDDGDVCTVGDDCQNGLCVGAPKACDDSEPCTIDHCDSQTGCVHEPTTQVCDDGDACTGGDLCLDGACIGAPLLCKDFNGCTRDMCTSGVGCDYIPEPFGTPCDDNDSNYGICWDGVCVDWHVQTLLSIDDQPSRALDVQRMGVGSPVLVVGSHGFDGASEATRWSVDHQTLALTPKSQVPTIRTFHAMADDFAVGSQGTLVAGTTALDLIDVGVSAGVDLRAVTLSGATLFLGGDGYGVASPHSTLLRCPLVAGEVQSCLRMPVVHSPEHCSKQSFFHVRRLLALSSQKLLVSGFTIRDLHNPESDDFEAHVALWDGNTKSSCPGLGVYSGEVYTNHATSSYTLAVNAHPPGVREGFYAMGAVSLDDIWVAGARGAIQHHDGLGWSVVHPQVWSETAAWNEHHDVYDLVVTEDDVHFVGDGVGARVGGCRDTFYLHAARQDGQWAFDHLVHFSSIASDCGEPPFDNAGIRAITQDPMTGDLIGVGWAPDDPLIPTTHRALVMRLERP